MAKTIKFNLILDGYPIRTLEDLQEHFSIEDILDYQQNGLLARWLDVRGYESQRNAVKAINNKNGAKQILKDLIRIFEIPIQPADVDKAIAILGYLNKQKHFEERCKQNAMDRNLVIESYHTEYNKLIGHMIDNSNNMSLLKADVLQLEREYKRLFHLDFQSLYFKLLNAAPKAIYAMMTRQFFRDYLFDKDVDPNIKRSITENLSKPDKISVHLESDVIYVDRNTSGNWDPIEPPSRKVMVLYAGNASVRNADVRGEQIAPSAVNEHFPILRGLDIQSTSSSSFVFYMEV